MRYLFFFVGLVVLAGCGVDVLMSTAVQGDLQAKQMKAMQGQLQHATNTVGQLSVERAIAAYKADVGAIPPSLDALVPTYLPELPVKADGTPFGYDPASGQLITETPGADGPTGRDLKALETINAAIYTYGQNTGYYPVTLNDLAPDYLESVPMTASGEAFLYDNQNGVASHPRAPQAQPRQGTAAVGSGMLGEVTGGMAIQEELNRQSTAGADAVSRGARGMLGQSTSDHGNQQNQVMDDLGM